MTYFWSDLYHHCEKLPITNILWKAYTVPINMYRWVWFLIKCLLVSSLIVYFKIFTPTHIHLKFNYFKWQIFFIFVEILDYIFQFYPNMKNCCNKTFDWFPLTQSRIISFLDGCNYYVCVEVRQYAKIWLSVG